MMTPERQVEAMARIEFVERVRIIKGVIYIDNGIGATMLVERYLTNYNSVHRVLRGLSLAQLFDYDEELRKLVRPDSDVRCHQATCAQMTEAILRACGVWVEIDAEETS